MKLRYATLLISAVAIVAFGLVATSPVSAESAAPATAGGGYKIGIVKFQEVVDGYGKLKTQMDAIQKQADAKGDEFKKKKDAYTKKVEDYQRTSETLSEDARRTQEDALTREMQALKGEADMAEKDLQTKVRHLKEDTMKEIIAVINKIGAAEGYHLILDANPDGLTGAVIYFSPTIDITTKVQAALYGGAAPAAPAGSAK